MKRISQVFLVVLTLLVSSTLNVSAQANGLQEDMNTIKERLIDYFLAFDTIDDGAKVEAVFVKDAEEHLNSMNEDGSWDGIDYGATQNAANGKAWDPYLALDRMQAITIAYRTPGHALYKKQAVIESINRALLHWGEVKPRSTNWWENDIGVNLRFGRIGLFLENELSSGAMEVITSTLNKEGKYKGTGQNNLWYDQNAIYRALITNDSVQLKKVIDECLAYVLVLQEDNTTLEALQVDNSLYFHGIQFYSNGYGLSMFRDMSFWLYMLRDTDFMLSDEVVNRMSDYMLDGTKWTIRGDIAELYLGYRPYKYDVGYENYSAEYIAPLERMMIVDPNRSVEYSELLSNIKGERKDNGSVGNNYMWRVGYGSQMNEKYGVNIKMDSKRITGGEWRGSWPSGEDKGNLIYWTSSASSTFLVDGDEYTSIFPTFDWAHSPGVTSPNFIPKNYSNYGRFNNSSDHTIGLSNGDIGSTSYSMNKYNTKVNKSYFFFGDEIVAMGSGIESSDGSAIHTTINQTKSDNLIVNGESVKSETKNQSIKVDTIHNNNIGYIFNEGSEVVINNGQQMEMPSLWDEEFKGNMNDTFSAWIDHGIKPKDASYSYIVVPGLNQSEFDMYREKSPIKILENSKNIHAVTNTDTMITQINFFTPGEFEYAPGKKVSVDQAVNLMIDESGSNVTISVALTDTDYDKSVNVIMNDVTTSFMVLPAPYTGKTMTLELGDSNRVTASSSLDGHEAEFAFDGDFNTSWKSDGDEDQWLSINLGSSVYVSSLGIEWGTQYAENYIIQGSHDGVNYFDIKQESSNTGGEQKVDVGYITNFIRLMAINSNNGEGIQVYEIEVDFGSNLSLESKVEVSSTSTNDPGNISTKAIDGDKSSRWSSKRDSNQEWIILDLGGKAEISALNLLWESARSGEYTIDISDDKKSWTTIKTIDSPDGLLDSILLDSKVHARYLRINSTKSVTPKYGISLFELEIFGNVELNDKPDNLALNRPSESSSNYINKSGFEHDSKFAFDGSIEDAGEKFQSRWVSQRESADEWILVDLESNYSLDSVELNWEGAHAKQYKIMTSLDKENWQEAAYISDGSAGIRTIEFEEPIDARYVKMQAIEYSGKYGYSLWEFEIYGKPMVDKNLALNNDVRSSSSFVDPKTKFKYIPEYAVDGLNQASGGKFQSRWVSDRKTENEWIYVKLDGLYSVHQVTLDWEGAHANDYLIQQSNDGLHWVDVEHVTDGRAGVRDHLFSSPFEAQYVRIKGLTPATVYGFSIWEFEVYGSFISPSFIDNSKLQERILDLVDTQDNLYTKESYNNFKNSLDVAIQVNTTHTTQDMINEALVNLDQAFNNLIEREDQGLIDLIERFDLLDATLYTESTYGTLKDLIDQAKTLVATGAYFNQEYQDLQIEVEEAFEDLVENGNIPNPETEEDVAALITSLTVENKVVKLPKFKGFEISIASSDNLEVIDLSGNVYPKDEDVIVKLVLRVNKEFARSEGVLTNEIEVLVKQNQETIDYQGLIALLDFAETLELKNYTQESQTPLVQAIALGKQVLTNGSQNQTEVNDVVKIIKDSIANLVKLGNKEKLIELVESLKDINLDGKTHDSILRFKSALSNANDILKDGNADQLEVDHTYKLLEQAFNGLEDIVVDIPEEPIDPNPTPPTEEESNGEKPETDVPSEDAGDISNGDGENSKELPITGLQSNSSVMQMGVIFAGIIILYIRKKMKVVNDIEK